ncbi:guanine nucleotide exchange factor-like protein [Hirsutella rhossiliensis]|uniref:Guanine nucleotide-exchange factor SEC12 n=1 Tax=Hirsutella rhossiliensis TaxID=111463 RepID=A0A9P8N7B0_9HYPO|nr:guanine nucleotide exchange factor-like protein [Hirsutella rhossiliensis]KAH0965952.1 guanine nucleotide exchange factor-like protein [Hirsutella rhossiliensis]
MAPPFPCATIELDYPLYALDFDPEDARRLVVGGGGGAGRSGVGNKITALEAPAHDELRVAGDIELSRDEDSVMSLAVGGQRGKSTRVLAGVNSSPADLAKGTNHHLRVLAIDSNQSRTRSSPSAKNSDARVKVAELSRTALFANPHPDTYQRLLRIAGPVGAAASAMGSEPQIAVFETAGGAAARPKMRGLMELPADAEDLDIVQKGEDEFQLAFCYKHELHVVDIGKQNSDPELIFTMPDDHGRRPVFRSIRYLSPDFILAAANLPGRTGVLIQGFRLPSPGHEKARIAVTARIPRKIAATALAVANLSPPSPSWGTPGNTQFVVAVAGHDSSISLYTLEHRPSTVLNLLIDLHPLCTLVDVHGAANITGLAFSRFVTPKTHARAQFVKLASTSLQKTVAVHSIPLKKHVDGAPRNKKGPPRPVRYVVAMRSRKPSSRPIVIALALIVLVMGIVGQAVMEAYGRSQPALFAPTFLSSWHGTLRSPKLEPLSSPAGILDNVLVSRLMGGGGGDAVKTPPAAGETMVLFEAPQSESERPGAQIQVGVHDSAVHGPARTWDELGAEQKRIWQERLREAGAWSQGMGESVFKGILFGEIAGAIGRAMEG